MSATSNIEKTAAKHTPDTPPAEAPADERNVKKLFARSSAWALVQYGTAQVIRLGSNLILWRLLFPDAFGLMSIVNAFIIGLTLISDIGIGQNVIRHERGEDPDFLNTIWTLQVIRGLALAVIACAAAVPVARFYNQPQLAGLLAALALGQAIGAFSSTNVFTAGRRMAIARLTVMEVVCQVVRVLVMIGWAYASPSVWALAIGTICGGGLRSLLSHVMLPGIRNRFRLDRATAREVAHFGRWVLVSTLLMYASTYSDRLIFGKLVSIEMLGVYNIAATWATIPAYLGSHVISAVLFPLFSRSKGAALAERFRSLRGVVLLASAWLVSCLVAGGPALIQLLYDQRARAAGVIVQLLAIGAWFATLESANGAALLSLGKPKVLAIGNGAKLIAMTVLMVVGAKLFGFHAAVLAFALADAARYAVSTHGCSQLGLNAVRQDAGLTVMLALTVGVGLAAGAGYHALGLQIASGRLDAFLEGTVIFIVLTAIWGAVFLRARQRSRVLAPVPVPE